MSRNKGDIEILDEVVLRPPTYEPPLVTSSLNMDIEDLSNNIKILKWKSTLGVLNTVSLVFALSLIFFMFHLDAEWSQFEPFLQYYIAAPGVSIVLLCFALIMLNCFGYYIIYKHRYSYYIWFTIIACILMVYEMKIVLTGLIYNDETDHISRMLDVAMGKYNNSTMYRSSMDYMQYTLECCGKSSAMDWLTSYPYYIPLSCCPRKHESENSEKYCLLPEDKDIIFPNGCLDELLDVPIAGLHILYYSIAALIIIKILFMIFSSKLACMTDEET